jgi:hypothetical protein
MCRRVHHSVRPFYRPELQRLPSSRRAWLYTSEHQGGLTRILWIPTIGRPHLGGLCPSRSRHSITQVCRRDLGERGFHFRDKASAFTLVAGEPSATRRHCRKALPALITVAIPGPVSSGLQQRCDRLDQRAAPPSHLPVGSARRGHPRRRDGEKLPSIVERGS